MSDYDNTLYDNTLVHDEKKEERDRPKKEYITLSAKDNDLALRCIKTIQNVAHLAGFSVKGPLVLIDDKTKIRWK